MFKKSQRAFLINVIFNFRCVTCGQEGLSCPGHIGHIELILPVYNPFLMDILLKLLK